MIGKVFQHFKGGKYIVLSIVTDTATAKETVAYMNLLDKKVYTRELSEFEGLKELPNGEVVKRFRLLDGYSLVDGALNERERILDLIDREIENPHKDRDMDYGLYRAKELINA